MMSPRSIVAGATALHAAVGAWIATSITGPLLAIDDLAYLSMGRTLAGGGASPLSAQPPYGVLYPALLAPGWLVGFDESQMIVFAQVVNALLGAALLPVLYVLLRRLTDASGGRALAAAAIGASLPAALLTGSIVWTERLLPLLVALAVLALLRLADAPTSLRAVEVSLLAAALYATHPRTIVVAIVVIAAGMWIVAASRDRVALTALWLSGHAGLALAELARRALASETFGAGATYDGADLASRRGLDDVPEMLVHATASVAYLALATAGFAVLGAIMLFRQPSAAAFYAAMFAATVAVAGWFLTGVGRGDAYLHGRYIEVLAPSLVALGIVGAHRLSLRVSMAALTLTVLAAGLVAAWAGPGNNWAGSRTPVMMLGVEVSGAPFGAMTFRPELATAVALVAGILILAAARGAAWMPALVAGAVIAVAVVSGAESIDSLRDNTTVGQVQAAMDGVEVEELFIDSDRLPSTLVAAMAWEVGFDRTTTEISIDMTHLLLPTGAVPPPGSLLVSEIGVAVDEAGVKTGGGVLWQLG